MEGIALALAVCLILAYAARRISVPPIPLYIIAGIILGENGLSLIGETETAAFLSHLGLIFLLFYVGLELTPTRIRTHSRSFLKSGFVDLNINLCIGLAAGILIGLPLVEALVFAAAFYISSSAIVFTSLVERGRLVLPETSTIVWMMIFEDLALVAIIALFSAGGSDILMLAVRIAAMVAIIYGGARIFSGVIEEILNRSEELPVLFTFSSVVVVAFAAQAAGVPDTLAAIVLGSAFSTIAPGELDAQSRPFRDVFLVIFFVFFGVSVQFGSISILPVVLAVSAAAIASKALSGHIIGWWLHRSRGAGIEIAATTIPRGEFSIAIATLFASPAVIPLVAGMVIATSVVGSLTAHHTRALRRRFAPTR